MLYSIALRKNKRRWENHYASALFPQLRYFNRIDDSEFQHELISTIKNNDNFQKYVLTSGKIGQHLQKEIGLQATDVN